MALTEEARSEMVFLPLEASLLHIAVALDSVPEAVPRQLPKGAARSLPGDRHHWGVVVL